MLSFKQLQEKKTKVLINPKKEDIMEKDKSLNHGEDCGCMKCDKQRRKDELGDEKSVSTEQKIYDSNKEVSEESTESNAKSDNTETNLLTFEKFHKFHKKKKQEDDEKPESYIETKMEETEYHVMSKKSYKKLHKDFKGGTKDKPRATVGVTDKMGNTTPTSRLVKFSEAKYESGASNYGKASIRNKRAYGYGGNAKPPAERSAAMTRRSDEHKARRNVKKGNKYGSPDRYKPTVDGAPSDEFKKNRYVTKEETALDIVKKGIIAKYGKGAIMRKGSNQAKKVKGAKSTTGTNKYKDMADRKKQTAADAKKRGFKSTQNYVDTMARYGGKDNYDKGKGLGT